MQLTTSILIALLAATSTLAAPTPAQARPAAGHQSIHGDLKALKHDEHKLMQDMKKHHARDFEDTLEARNVAPGHQSAIRHDMNALKHDEKKLMQDMKHHHRRAPPPRQAAHGAGHQSAIGKEMKVLQHDEKKLAGMMKHNHARDVEDTLEARAVAPPRMGGHQQAGHGSKQAGMMKEMKKVEHDEKKLMGMMKHHRRSMARPPQGGHPGKQAGHQSGMMKEMKKVEHDEKKLMGMMKHHRRDMAKPPPQGGNKGKQVSQAKPAVKKSGKARRDLLEIDELD